MIKALLLSKDEDLEVHLKKELILRQCQYFSKTEDQCSQAMEQAAKKAFENNMHHHDTMQEMARTYLSNQECSDQQTLYYIFAELKLRKIFLALYFINTNLPDAKIKILTHFNPVSHFYTP